MYEDKVGMGEYKIKTAPHIVHCSGLGSCVAVIIYDSINKIGGLAHIMLPNSEAAKEKSNLSKFADTGIDLMFNGLIKKGAQKEFLNAKIFGGANMFPSIKSSGFLHIGAKNIKAVTNKLENLAIKIMAQDVGGHKGRSIKLFLETGQVELKMIGKKNMIY
ncbi:MAG: chemotaxis protein CheD [Candidatus Margulisiibacteriota bacterium]|jgi:chemotaxis protein CheD